MKRVLAWVMSTPASVMRPARRPPEADERLDELALAVALDPGDADDLAAMDGERHVVEQRPHVLDDGEPCDVELDVVGDSRLASLGPRQLAAHHQLRELARGHLVRQHRRDRATGSNDGDRVRDGEHLVELVADEEHRHTFGREVAQRCEQLVDLLRHEHRGGLVEDQDAGAAVEHLEDLDPLAIADAEVGDQRASGLH